MLFYTSKPSLLSSYVDFNYSETIKKRLTTVPVRLGSLTRLNMKICCSVAQGPPFFLLCTYTASIDQGASVHRYSCHIRARLPSLPSKRPASSFANYWRQTLLMTSRNGCPRKLQMEHSSGADAVTAYKLHSEYDTPTNSTEQSVLSTVCSVVV
jgi:hypothetical protein